MTLHTRRWTAVALTCAALTTSACTLPGGAKASRTAGAPAVSQGSTPAAPSPATASSPAATMPPSMTAASASVASPSDQASPTASVGASTLAPTMDAATATAGAPSPLAPSASLPGGVSAPASPSQGPPPSPIAVNPGQTVALTAVDAAGDGWERGGHVPSGSGYLVESLAGQASCGGPAMTLTFVLAQPTTGSATFQLAQDAHSASTGERLAWSSDVDGLAGPSTTVSYAERVSLSVPLNGARRVTLKLANQAPCTGTATGLVTGAVIDS